jgi:peptide-methionine (S)-S-oxide reductase
MKTRQMQFCLTLSLACIVNAFAGDSMIKSNPPVSSNAVAMFGAGCFWCSEAVFQLTPGVLSVVSGYAGGSTKNPTYKEVCTGNTGHAEVVRVEFDPKRLAYPQLLDLFWGMHDPTTLNQQGADQGTQYRSVIFYFSPEQKTQAEASRQALSASGKLSRPIVTEISPAPAFYPAEDYHRDYYNQNRSAPYCRFVIEPKIMKLKKK